MVEQQSRREEENSPITERTVKINRVSKVVKGGRHLSFSAVVVVGDGEGDDYVHTCAHVCTSVYK